MSSSRQPVSGSCNAPATTGSKPFMLDPTILETHEFNCSPIHAHDAPATTKRQAGGVPSFIAALPSHLEPATVEFLANKGVFEAPSRAVVRQCFSVYWDNIHPIFPVLHPERMTLTSSPAAVSNNKQNPRPGLLEVYATIMAVCPFAPVSLLQKLGHNNAQDAQQLYYERVRHLLHCDVESDPISRLQALLLMTQSTEVRDGARDCCFWSGTALAYAESLDLLRMMLGKRFTAVQRAVTLLEAASKSAGNPLQTPGIPPRYLFPTHLGSLGSGIEDANNSGPVKAIGGEQFSPNNFEWTRASVSTPPAVTESPVRKTAGQDIEGLSSGYFFELEERYDEQLNAAAGDAVFGSWSSSSSSDPYIQQCLQPTFREFTAPDDITSPWLGEWEDILQS
ncbi:hypothetical protein AYO20_08714 [Fonsecaea nubica]|uniref:Xylanolytic transcriptional activator regulatory domain-containing protein n=1 Tax=Fonsecaea nubica TaxID=856822 RepID=A0A178CNH7_9EURO|nr:hypothetical protein AYO20_08714 [Fonsecaea nubica]OAL30495.1 hypothetical protein AYO20_08714 [Fonsecaea nubica]